MWALYLHVHQPMFSWFQGRPKTAAAVTTVTVTTTASIVATTAERAATAAGGGSVFVEKSQKVGSYWGYAMVRVRYDAHLPAMSLQDREKSRNLLEAMFLSTLHGHKFCKK